MKILEYHPITRAPISTLAMAFSRGNRACTFATSDELRTPGYDEAYSLGLEYHEGRVVEPHCSIGCGCPGCRLRRIIRKHEATSE